MLVHCQGRIYGLNRAKAPSVEGSKATQYYKYGVTFDRPTPGGWRGLNRKFYLDSVLVYFPIVLGMLWMLTGCQPSLLNVQTQYLSHENLASFRINTPDPELEKPIIGQRLVIDWFIPKSYNHDNLCLNLKVRFKDHQEEAISISLNKRSGTYLHSILQEKYLTTNGISTYKVDLKADNVLISSWKHPLWTDLITFKINAQD